MKMADFAIKLRVTVALTVIAVGGMLLSGASAQAATATITGGPALSGSATTATLFKLNTAGKTQSCTGSTANGTVAASTIGSFPPGFRVGTLTMAFTGCTVVGGLGISVSCLPAALNVNAATVGGSTRGSITGINCKLFLTTQTACRYTLTGSMGVTFRNGPATITTDTNHQSLAMIDSTNGAGGTCAFPFANDPSVRFLNASNGDLQYNVSPTNLNISVTP
jgi:hypothetical protein